MKYTFISEDDYFGPWKNTTEFEADSIYEVVENFNLFLKGCAFDFQVVVDGKDNDTDFSSNDISSDVMAFTLDSLSMWNKDSSKVQSNIKKCEVCELPLDVVSRYECTDYICPVK